VPDAHLERALAKINLTLRVLGKRRDGYHEIDSLVAFAQVGDDLSFTPGRGLSLSVRGPFKAASGGLCDNLVLKAAQALANRAGGLRLGHFLLSKRLPVAAGLGGGSSDAAAALRLLARANRLAPDDPLLLEAARATGADVPVCLDPRPRRMRGVGEILSNPLQLPPMPAVLVNPRIALATKDVFAGLRAPRIAARKAQDPGNAAVAYLLLEKGRGETARAELLAALKLDGNDLEPAAMKLEPSVADALEALRALAGCQLARMSGSGATCFALFDTTRSAALAARALRTRYPAWWIRATRLA
jgi:4-diphosphocytidyl-2-C-methyl-D-erythritol kinase